MIWINDVALYDVPTSCGTCPFFKSGASGLCHPEKGLCTLWDEMHKTWINPPRRCQKLFRKGFREYDGQHLIIVANNE